MSKLRSTYYKNKYLIWITVLTVIGTIALIQTLNNYYKNNPNEKISNTKNISTTSYNKPNYSVISQKEIAEEEVEETQDIISYFFDCCNNRRFEEAYNSLSKDCKKNIYPTLEVFLSSYINKMFTEPRIYNSLLWISSENSNTYKLEIMGDILATGKKENMKIEDFFTVIYEDGEYRLNISNFVDEKEINKSNFQYDVNIEVLNKKEYMDCEIYEITVKNDTEGNILFSTKKDMDSIYLEDENGLKYRAFLTEMSEYDLNILQGQTKKYDIKFNRSYNPSIRLDKMIFNNITTKSGLVNMEVTL